MSRNPGVKIIESSTPSVGAAGMSGLVPLLVGAFWKKDGTQANAADGAVYVANYAEFAEKFVAAPLIIKLAPAWGQAAPLPEGGDEESGEEAGGVEAKKSKKATKEADSVAAATEVPFTSGQPTKISSSYLYDNSSAAVASYFSNGGGACYLLALSASDAKDDLEKATAELDEVSLYVPLNASAQELVKGSIAAIQEHNPQSLFIAHAAFTGSTPPAGPVMPKNEFSASYTPELKLESNFNVVNENGIFLGNALLSAQRDKAVYKTVKDNLALAPLDFSAVSSLTLSPVAAVAGAYCTSERNRGVWKAPANVSLVGVTPVHTISAQEHGVLNEAGVNAILWSPQKGTSIMGARTSADPNITNWRYVPVRLLFNTVERDVSAMLAPIIFQPNSAPTWQAVVAGISNYLHGIWKRGGLFGNSPEEAYRVQIALQDGDIDNGILRVRVSLAALRPVEFIDLEFTQELLAAA
ncbi:phage tail sheath family protein [Candidatus Pantoea multigeneris]|uniref:Phage tail sheath family protein n=1 Tax=Candidatus Pantoea multigeneris TaxID=2608357 RepID=A0ABX0R574_9GAMM|nr:phage tail sheath family protein [Pantoea multigeneris]NIF20558.1 phage tail sheath family protein [Pantoea multigeneris]